MRKKISKNYPKFDRTRIYSNDSVHWCKRSKLPPVPSRFQNLYHKESIGSNEENFIMVDGDVGFAEDTRHTAQDAWFMFPEMSPFISPREVVPVVLQSSKQLRGQLYNGDVDFLIGGGVELENGGLLLDNDSRRNLRYPYRIATYYPIRNVLLMKNLLHGSPTPSLKNLVEWIFTVTNSLGYKYNKFGDALLIGCDPEFTITDILDERISAQSIFPDPNRDLPIGTDGHSNTGELRPAPSKCPLDLTRNIKKLMAELATKLGNDKKILTGGGGTIASLGHHIHFSIMLSSDEIELQDDFVGRPALRIKGSKRPDSGFEALGQGAVRRQPHGCEYRTAASSLIPELTDALHTTAYCCVMKWHSLQEGESFEFDIDQNTKIPTLDSYRMLDITDDKRYTPHLEEMWKWANHVDGREIDPKRDILYRWVEGRKEVKPKPGLKVNWGGDIFPTVEKENFIELPSLDKIYDITVVLLPPTEEETRRIVQICLSEEDQIKINNGHPIVLEGKDTPGWAQNPLDQLIALKVKYRIDGIPGFKHPTRKIGVTKNFLNSLGSMNKLKRFVLDVANIICV
jgi:hypothetical protein